MIHRQDLISEFWEYAYNANIDDIKPGKTGFVRHLLELFKPLLSLQPFGEEIRTCHSCETEDVRRLRWPVPIEIHDCNHLKLSSFQKYFEWYLNSKHYQHCEVCLQAQVEIVTNYKSEPNFIIIDFIGSSDHNENKYTQLEYNDIIENPNTKSKFQLISTINMPYFYHFNCCLYNPITKIQLLDGNLWYLHDGLDNNGTLTPLVDVSEIWEQKPIILFYKKLNTE